MKRTLAVALALGVAGVARAGDEDLTHRFPSPAVHTHERAGYPRQVSKRAKPGRTHAYTGGYVGGGMLAIFPRKPDGREVRYDGTWGWDYVGFGRRPGRVFLDWWHDRPKQPQPGPYKTDGPHVPDVIALHPIQRLVEGKHGEHKPAGHRGKE
jgi:hypothetical protein